MDESAATAAQRMVDVPGQALSRKSVESVRSLATAHGAERLQLALAASQEIAFDWTLADDRIAWSGAAGVLSLHHDINQLAAGSSFLAWMTEAGRAKLL